MSASLKSKDFVEREGDRERDSVSQRALHTAYLSEK